MNVYHREKERVRNTAIAWQNDFSEHNYSYGELVYYQEYFVRLAKKYGLVKEFKENGII